MKYIISESKLNTFITDYLDKMFDVDDINSTSPTEYDDETGYSYDDFTRVQFYTGDYIDEDEACFRWYDCEYFDEGSGMEKKCPLLTIDSDYGKTLNGYFGDTWHEPFKKWFITHFELPVKTIEGFE